MTRVAALSLLLLCAAAPALAQRKICELTVWNPTEAECKTYAAENDCGHTYGQLCPNGKAKLEDGTPVPKEAKVNQGCEKACKEKAAAAKDPFGKGQPCEPCKPCQPCFADAGCAQSKKKDDGSRGDWIGEDKPGQSYGACNFHDAGGKRAYGGCHGCDACYPTSKCTNYKAPASDFKIPEGANCHAEKCHNDGHWVEVAFPEGDSLKSLKSCYLECEQHEQSTAMQFNHDGGFCGCLKLDGIGYADAVKDDAKHIHDEATECTLCNFDHKESCCGEDLTAKGVSASCFAAVAASGHADNCDDCAGLEKPEDVPVSCQKCVLNKFACPKAAEKKPAAKDGAAEDALGDAAQSASSALQASAYVVAASTAAAVLATL